MRKILLSVVVAACALWAVPTVASAQGTIMVFVTASGAESGFSAGKGANDSVLDLSRALGGKQRLSLVNSPDNADVIVEVESRDSHWDTGGVYNWKSKSGKNHYFTTTQKERTVYCTLKVDDYSRQIHGTGTTWTAASGNVARQIDKWVEQNIVKLVELREERKQR